MKRSFGKPCISILAARVISKIQATDAFYFANGTISSAKLYVIIKDVIRAVLSTGFNVVLATVCDQGPTNMGALKMLKTSGGGGGTDQEVQNSFLIGSKKIGFCTISPICSNQLGIIY